MKKYLNEREVSLMTGVSVSTLQTHRALNKGMPYFKLGKLIRYKLDDVEKYMESHRIDTKPF